MSPLKNFIGLNTQIFTSNFLSNRFPLRLVNLPSISKGSIQVITFRRGFAGRAPSGSNSGFYKNIEKKDVPFGGNLDRTSGIDLPNRLRGVYDDVHGKNVPPPPPGTFSPAGSIAVPLIVVLISLSLVYINYENHVIGKQLIAELERRKLPPAIKTDEFTEMEVKEVEILSHNTKRISLAVPAKHRFPIPVTSFVLLKGVVNGEEVIRPYTPVNQEKEITDRVDFVIKRYENGKLTPYLHSLAPGDKVQVKGPIEKFPLPEELPRLSHINLIAGGTGITPMLQIIKAALRDDLEGPKSRITLIYANVSEKDVLLKDELERLRVNHGYRFNVQYVLEKPINPGWDGETGYITKKFLAQHFPYPGLETIKIFVCGPPGMMKHVCGEKAPDYSQGELKGLLAELGYKPEQVYKF